MNLINTRKPICVHAERAIPARVDYAAIDTVFTDEEADLLLEAVTLAEVEFEYVGDDLTMPDMCAMFEAISTTRTALARSMRAFGRKLNQALNGEIKTVTGTDGEAEVGGVEVGKVRKVAGIPIIVARMPLSDGQSVSLIFHSPTANGSTIQGSDVLTVFRFLLNKRDVTHVVAPQSGADIALTQVTMLLARLITANSPKFQRQASISQRTRKDLEATEADILNLEQQQDALTTQADQANIDVKNAESAATADNDRITQVMARTAKMTEERDRLAQALADAKQTMTSLAHITHPQEAYADGYRKAVDGDTRGAPRGMSGELTNAWYEGFNAYNNERDAYETEHGNLDGFLPNPNPVIPGHGHGNTENDSDPVNKMEEQDNQELTDHAELEQLENQEQRDEENAEHEDQTSALFWYGCRIRPPSPGAIPDGQQAILTVDETAALEIVTTRGITEDYFRHGAIGYAQALTPDQVEHFNLTDFANTQTDQTLKALAVTLENYVKQLRADNPDLSFDDMWTEYFLPRGAYTSDNPLKDADGNYAPKVLMQIAKKLYPGMDAGLLVEHWYDNYVVEVVEEDDAEQVAAAITAAHDAIQALLQFKSEEINDWQEKQDDLAQYAQVLADNNAYDKDAEKVVEIVGKYLSDSISVLTNGQQRDLDTGEEQAEDEKGKTIVVDDENAVTEQNPPEVVEAVTYMTDLLELQTESLDIIREARGRLRAIHADLTAAGVYAENEDLFNRSARHLGDLMAAIAQKGRG